MIVDFHVHSTASDGTCSPAELAEKARGFAAIALTDHDNCDGIREWPGVPGIELSIEPGEGFDKFHLLGLGIDSENAELKAFLRRVLDGRNGRNARILENFRRLGIEMENIFTYAHGEVLARPHFARWLLEHGLVVSIKEAFEKYLLPDSPAETRCYEERWHPSQEEAFRVVHGAGGICVMAHPKYWRRDWKTTGPDYVAAERGLAALKEKGLDGVEALYQANSVEENIEFTRIVTRLGYLTTAGSDFHGAILHLPGSFDRVGKQRPRLSHEQHGRQCTGRPALRPGALRHRCANKSGSHRHSKSPGGLCCSYRNSRFFRPADHSGRRRWCGQQGGRRHGWLPPGQRSGPSPHRTVPLPGASQDRPHLPPGVEGGEG